MANKQSTQEMVPVESGAVELLKQGVELMKLENESQQKMAILKPRNEKQILESTLEELQDNPEYAQTYYYVIPYSKSKGSSETVDVTGLSIGAAMALLRRWGNCSTGARVVSDMDDRVTVEGVCIDYETNLRVLNQVSVSRKMWSKANNGYFFLSPDRLNLAIQAGMSKAKRNAILALLPNYIKDRIFKEAKQLAGGGGDKKRPKAYMTVEKKAETLGEIMTSFKELGVTSAMLEKYSGKTINKMTPEELGVIIGIRNAIKEGQTTAQEVFSPATEKPTGPITKGDIFGKK